MKFFILGAVFALTLSSAYSISEENYKEEYQQKVVPLLKSYQYGAFKGQNQVQINYARYMPNQTDRCVVILPGRSEPIEKYAEVIHSLEAGRLQGEFNYFLMDHRGQGSSGRVLEDSQKGHVEKFEYYALDLKQFMDEVVLKSNCNDVSLVAHSLGAGVGVDFLQKYKGYFSRAALSSPMLKIQTKPYSYAVAKAVVVANVAAKKGNEYGAGQGAFNPDRNFEKNSFTTSLPRFEMIMNLFDELPETRLGGVTNRWLYEVMKGTQKIRMRYKRIDIPLQVYTAGIELYSYPSEMVKLCQKVAECDHLHLPTAKHEVLMDKDENRDQVIVKLEDFLF